MPARVREWLEVLLLAAIVVLVLARSAYLGSMVAVARASRDAIRTDDELLHSVFVLGPEYPILEALRRDHPGAAVAVEGHDAFVARAQRFWLALLPEHRVTGDADLVVCPRPCAEPGDRVLVHGGEFDLLDRSDRR